MKKRRPISTASRPGSAAGSASVAAAIEFAKLHRGDCTNIVIYEALRETGMLDAYLNRSKA